MKPRHRRLALVLGGVAALGLAAFFVLQAFQQNLVFFFTPSQIVKGEAPVGRSFRIGGMVEAGSHLRQADGLTHRFVVTDLAQRVEVRYQGLIPDLFKEGKGVVAQGRLQADGSFLAEEVLAKHDENYMPPEAARAIEQAKAGGTTKHPGVRPAVAQGEGARP